MPLLTTDQRKRANAIACANGARLTGIVFGNADCLVTRVVPGFYRLSDGKKVLNQWAYSHNHKLCEYRYAQCIVQLAA